MKISFFILYLFAVLLCGSIYLGDIGLTVRHVAVILMLIFLGIKFFSEKWSNKIPRVYIKFYLFYLLVLAIALILNGDFESYDYLKLLLSLHFVSIVTFFAVDYFVDNRRCFLFISIAFMLLLLADSFVTYLQYNNDPIGWAVGMFFSDIADSESFFSNHDTALGTSVTPGIFGHVVNNATFLTTLIPFGIIIISNRKSNIFINTLTVLCLILLTLGVFFTQQRVAFFTVILFFLLIIWTLVRKNPLKAVIISLLILLPVIVYYIDYIVNVDVGRLANSDQGDTRLKLYSSAVNYITENFFLGGPTGFEKITGYSAHNIILDSFINAGLFGFCSAMLLYFYTIIHSLKSFRIYFKKNDLAGIAYHSSLLIVMFLSMFHNVSFLTGDAIIFVVLAMALKYDRLTLSSRKIK